MTIEEFKTKLDEYLGMVGILSPVNDERWSENHDITYYAPSGVPIVTYHIVRSKSHKMPHGWYESGSNSTNLPCLDPDTKLNRDWWQARCKILETLAK